MRNYEDVVIVFFLRRVLDLDSDLSFSEIALDLAHLVFSSPLDYSHFREGNGDRKGKRKKKEEKKRRKFVSSPQGNYIFPWNYLSEILFIE